MRKFTISTAFAICMILLSTAVVIAEVNAITPSTNDINRTNGWAHVDQISKDVGETTLEFISTRGFYSCFEYRTDGDTSQASGDPNYNPAVTDGLYPYVCENNSSTTMTFYAEEYVEVRMVFGAETDERFDWTRFDVDPPPPTGEITKPAEGEILWGMVDLEAIYNDDDPDGVQWAVRQGTCAANTNTVAGNVDGFHTDFSWDGALFTATVDTSGWPAGDYCFIFNPRETGNEPNMRLTRWFVVTSGYVYGGGQLIEEFEGVKSKDWYKISFGGGFYEVDGPAYVGEWEINFHNVGDDAFDKSKFHTTETIDLNLFDGDSGTCNDAMNFTALGTWNGEPGYKIIFRAGDFGSPNTMDTVRVTLYHGSTVVYDTHTAGEFTDESSCVGSARTGLDAGNITIINP